MINRLEEQSKAFSNGDWSVAFTSWEPFTNTNTAGILTCRSGSVSLQAWSHPSRLQLGERDLRPSCNYVCVEVNDEGLPQLAEIISSTNPKRFEPIGECQVFDGLPCSVYLLRYGDTACLQADFNLAGFCEQGDFPDSVRIANKLCKLIESYRPDLCETYEAMDVDEVMET